MVDDGMNGRSSVLHQEFGKYQYVDKLNVKGKSSLRMALIRHYPESGTYVNLLHAIGYKHQ